MVGAQGGHRSHRPGLDGLRGLAVVAVVAYHLGYLTGGFLGVDVFFVLSGYLITGLALQEIEGRGHLALGAFWMRRIRRLLPALLLMVTVVVAVALLLGWPHDRLGALSIDGLSTVTWWNNWRQAGGASYWASGELLFRHAWSLSIEEQFYLVWPILLVAGTALAHRFGWSLKRVIGAIAAMGVVTSATWQLVLSHRLSVDALSRVYVGTDTRAAAPLLGCLLACAVAGLRPVVGRWPARRVLGYAGGLVLVWMIFTVDVAAPSLYLHGWLVVASLSATALVAAAGIAEHGDRDLLARLVTARSSRYLGGRSYAIYLWSWPVQVLVRFQWPGIPRWALAIVVVSMSLVLAELSYRYVEDPLRRRTGWAAARRPRRTAWLGGMAGAFTVLLIAAIVAVPPPAHERIDTAESASGALHPVASTGSITTVAGEPAPLRVMVTGDSVGWTMGYYSPQGKELPKGIASIDSRAVIGCGLLAAEGWSYEQLDHPGTFVTPGGGACDEQAQAERIGLSGKPDVVLLPPGAWEWSSARTPNGRVVKGQSDAMAKVLRSRLRQRIDAANAAGARLALVAWSCPGSKAAGVRSDPDYIRWINGVMRSTVDQARRDGADAEMILPNEQVCVDADPLGSATEAKAKATGDEVHVVDSAGGRWIWDTWLGPALTAR